MKKLIALSSLALLLAACNDQATPVAPEQEEPETPMEEPATPETSETPTTEQPADNETSQQQVDTTIEGVEEREQALIVETVNNFSTAYAESVNTGTIQPLMNGIIMHGTDYNIQVEQDVLALHGQGIAENPVSLEVSLMKKIGDTDYEAHAVERVEHVKDGKVQNITYERTYSLFYDYVEGSPEAPSFFKVVNVATKISE